MPGGTNLPQMMVGMGTGSKPQTIIIYKDDYGLIFLLVGRSINLVSAAMKSISHN
jgi:hypothetical protein